VKLLGIASCEGGQAAGNIVGPAQRQTSDGRSEQSEGKVMER
jgi:hypothetical protein